jgi:hypothetical protein
LTTWLVKFLFISSRKIYQNVFKLTNFLEISLVLELQITRKQRKKYTKVPHIQKRIKL